MKRLSVAIEDRRPSVSSTTSSYGSPTPYGLQRSRSSLDLAADVSKEVWLLTRLAAQLLWALRVSYKWILMTMRLILFVILCLPAFLQILYYWLFHPHVHKNIRYGFQNRNLLDIYTVPSTKNAKEIQHKRPVVVFLSGGAWIIGYKAWGSLMGKVMSECGIVFVTPDYRNFPQGLLPDMIEDVDVAMQWIFENIHHFGGDVDNITLVGQSAGAHIAACLLIEQALKEGSGLPHGWRSSKLRGFIGISGPYNIRRSIEAFHAQGLDRTILSRIMDHDISLYSPSLRILHPEIYQKPHITSCFPEVTLFHGTADKTVHWKSTREFAESLERSGVNVKTEYYEKKSHTDPIIEDPIEGDDPLMHDLLGIISKATPPKSPGPLIASETFQPPGKLMPLVFIHWARKVNPF